MANNLRAKEIGQQGMMDNYIQDGTPLFDPIGLKPLDAQDFFDLRMEMGKSISAPPPGLDSVATHTPSLSYFTDGLTFPRLHTWRRTR